MAYYKEGSTVSGVAFFFILCAYVVKAETLARSFDIYLIPNYMLQYVRAINTCANYKKGL